MLNVCKNREIQFKEKTFYILDDLTFEDLIIWIEISIKIPPSVSSVKYR